MKMTGDRIVFRDTAFKGNQDTLMTDSPKLTMNSRVYIRDAYIEGDVDFIYGRATTVIERSTIKALTCGSDTNNGYITAASTWKNNPYRLPDHPQPRNCQRRAQSDLPPRAPARIPGGEPDAIAQVLIRDTSYLPAAVKLSAPWTDISGFPWQEARFTEYRTPDRARQGRTAGPAADERGRTPRTTRSPHYLAGWMAGHLRPPMTVPHTQEMRFIRRK